MADDNKRMFKVMFRSQRDKRETTEQSIRLTIIGKKREKQHGHLHKVPFHKASDVSASTKADCYLQIWEMDFFRTLAHGKNLKTNYMLYKRAETDLNVKRNRLIATFPGVIVKDGNIYGFQPAANPVFQAGGVSSALNGQIIIKLKPVGTSDRSDYYISMPEYESVFELGTAIRNTRDHAFGNYQNIDPHQVHNVEASLRKQIQERDGFAVAFVADYSAAFPSTQEEEFHRQAEEMIATLPTFALENNVVKFGYYRISSYKVFKDRLRELRESVRKLLGMTTSPRIGTMAIYAHGRRTKINIDYNGYNREGSLRTDRVKDFVKQIKSHLSEYVVIPIFACSAGRGNVPNPDSMYGRAYPCEEIGGDSLAWTLLKELQRQRITHATVWAHTTAEHATRNSRLRVFSERGSVDFINLLLKKPRVPEKPTQKGYALALHTVSAPNPNHDQLTRYIRHLRSANLIRTISLQHAVYFPWRWNGGTDATIDTPGFNAEANRQTDKFYQEMRRLLPADPPVLEDRLTYEMGGRAYITGLAPGVQDTRLSEHFKYSEISSLANPMRLSVQLMRYVQLLRYRSRRNMIPKKIFEKGNGLAVQVSPNNEQNRIHVLNKAKQMVDEGLLTRAELQDEWIYITLAPKCIYFAIYYRVPDNAFKRAAETWKRKVEQYASYRKDVDIIILKEVKTETDFRRAWKEVYAKNASVGGIVIEGQLFTHASKDDGGPNGLEFRSSRTDDGTLTKGEITSLPRLNWDDQNGLLVLTGCNTGLIEKRGWTPAREFARSHRVRTVGQPGYAYFSQNDKKYVEINSASTQVYLWAYKRRKNGLFGDGSKMGGISYHPIVTTFIDHSRIVPRDVWGEQIPRYGEMASDWDYNTVVVHHSGNSGHKHPVAIEVLHMSQKNWDDVGYHFLIAPDGKVYEGRQLFYKGSHVKDANTGKIGVLVMGDFQHQWWDVDDDPTNQQISGLIKLVSGLKKIFPDIDRLLGHRDVNPGSECPGDVLYKKLDYVRAATKLNAYCAP